MSVPSHLIAKIDGITTETLLSDWQPLVQGRFTPLVMTAFGDLFLCDEAGRVHFLDLTFGKFDLVAASQDEFDRLCEDRERRQNWFIGHLVTELRKLHGELAVGQCFGCKVPIWLGGKLEASNFERTDIQVHFSVLGQLYRQTQHLPPGTKINDVRINS
ncbi:MAG: DUF1851 domain-containing protein [Verrucomicrobiales bacterium]|nr:DUF1851 domain-containing protein [Verrucomicrobiales bacterium]